MRRLSRFGGSAWRQFESWSNAGLLRSEAGPRVLALLCTCGARRTESLAKSRAVRVYYGFVRHSEGCPSSVVRGGLEQVAILRKDERFSMKKLIGTVRITPKPGDDKSLPHFDVDFLPYSGKLDTQTVRVSTHDELVEFLISIKISEDEAADGRAGPREASSSSRVSSGPRNCLGTVGCWGNSVWQDVFITTATDESTSSENKHCPLQDPTASAVQVTINSRRKPTGSVYNLRGS